MCIALPMRIIEVVDEAKRTVSIVADGAISADRAGHEIVSAALVADSEAALEALLGRWGIAHAGFLIEVLDDDDARSRLALFVAMDEVHGLNLVIRTN